MFSNLYSVWLVNFLKHCKPTFTLSKLCSVWLVSFLKHCKPTFTVSNLYSVWLVNFLKHCKPTFTVSNLYSAYHVNFLEHCNSAFNGKPAPSQKPQSSHITRRLPPSVFASGWLQSKYLPCAPGCAQPT